MSNLQLTALRTKIAFDSCFFLVNQPRTTARIHQWLSTCELDEATTDNTQTNKDSHVKYRCVTKSNRTKSVTPKQSPERHVLSNRNETDSGVYRSSLRIQLDHEVNEPFFEDTTSHRYSAVSPMNRNTTKNNHHYPSTPPSYRASFPESYNAVYL